MSERKVLNKYFPPDFDPNNIPKLRLEKNRQWNIRIMAPFNMRCSTCGEYIYKGKKFNSRKEDVEDDDYLGLKIFRFYIRCPRCVAEISFKTDPVNTDYALEAGATRNFEALKTAETLARKELEEKEAAEKNNPMKMLENRTKASLREMEMLETLEDLKQLNTRHADVDHEQMLLLNKAYEKTLAQLQEEEDDKFVESLFGGEGDTGIKRVAEEEETDVAVPVKRAKSDKPTDILMQKSQRGREEEAASSTHTAAVATKKQSKFGILVKKKSAKPELHRNSSSPLTASDRTQVVIAKSAGEDESASSCHVPAASSSVPAASCHVPAASSSVSAASSSVPAASSSVSAASSSVSATSSSLSAASSSLSAASSSVSAASSSVSAAVGSVPGAHDNISSGEVLTVDGLGLLGVYSDSDDSGND